MAVRPRQQDESAPLGALKWRCIGPPCGGGWWPVACDPRNDMTFYSGACAGSIWKTEDGGLYWRCVSDGFLGSATIGAWHSQTSPRRRCRRTMSHGDTGL